MNKKLLIWLKTLESVESKAKDVLERAPLGSLTVKKCRKRNQYYVDGNYVSKNNRKLLSALAWKKYNSTVLSRTKVQKAALKRFLKVYNPEFLKEIFSSFDTETASLIDGFYEVSDEKYAEQWQNSSYLKNSFPFGNTCFYSAKGEQMRSKTEVIIADRLNALGIPYRYECAVETKRFGILFPDFTILQKDTRQVFYLEHFGMMDNDEYRSKNFFRKLRIYSEIGIYPGINLIMTFEDRFNPINTEWLDVTLRRYLLT